VGYTAGRRKCGLMELLFSGPLVALRCGRKISPGLGCKVPCLYDKDMCMSGVTYYECYNVVTRGGSPISRKCMWLWTHLCIPSVVIYPFCLGILESGILWDVSVPCCCILAVCTNAAGGFYKFTKALYCRVSYCTTCAGAITTRFTISHTACFFGEGKVTCSRFICTVDVL